MRAWWARLRERWDILALIGCMLMAGWYGRERLATKADLHDHSAGETSIRVQIQSLAEELAATRTDLAATRADLAAVKDAANATRTDIKDLTAYLLNRPRLPRRSLP